MRNLTPEQRAAEEAEFAMMQAHLDAKSEERARSGIPARGRREAFDFETFTKGNV